MKPTSARFLTFDDRKSYKWLYLATSLKEQQQQRYKHQRKTEQQKWRTFKTRFISLSTKNRPIVTKIQLTLLDKHSFNQSINRSTVLDKTHYQGNKQQSTIVAYRSNTDRSKPYLTGRCKMKTNVEDRTEQQQLTNKCK